MYASCPGEQFHGLGMSRMLSSGTIWSPSVLGNSSIQDPVPNLICVGQTMLTLLSQHGWALLVSLVSNLAQLRQVRVSTKLKTSCVYPRRLRSPLSSTRSDCEDPGSLGPLEPLPPVRSVSGFGLHSCFAGGQNSAGPASLVRALTTQRSFST